MCVCVWLTQEEMWTGNSFALVDACSVTAHPPAENLGRCLLTLLTLCEERDLLTSSSGRRNETYFHLLLDLDASCSSPPKQTNVWHLEYGKTRACFNY